eukprot:CAMPEP_0168549252 /NCGR_PEP_ID=MMETSP0413-20121227/5003_1 /TAXON_ID=136452 /ORGANISM="Filamoeba nolandi, Strain NC-AS-23-1" /LENGTH=674 /DNA_ID=CAMNT_0008579625 /DNA_START=181 /DNA_END=2202 /DNA_ORIENTATION=+
MGGQYSSLVFQPSEHASYNPDKQGMNIVWIEDLSPKEKDKENSHASHSSVPVSGKRIPAIFYEWKGRNGEDAYFTILYSSATTEDLGHSVEWAKMLRDVLHVNVLCYEYTGFGINRQGKPSEKNCYEDIWVAYHWLVIAKEIPSDRIILYGKSLGTGPTIHLAATLYTDVTPSRSLSRRTIGKRLTKKFTPSEISVLFKGFAGIVLQSPMTSVLDLNKEISNALLTDIFENYKKMPKILCPAFLVHGAKDELVPIRHSHKLTRHIKEGCLIKFFELSEAGHFNIESLFGDEVLEELLAFVNALLPEDIREATTTKQFEIPDEYRSSPDKVIGNWLSKLGLGKYRDQFLAAGFYDLLTIQTMIESDLDLIGITVQEDRDKVLNAVKGMSTTSAAPTSAPSKPDIQVNANPIPASETTKGAPGETPPIDSAHESKVPERSDVQLRPNGIQHLNSVEKFKRRTIRGKGQNSFLLDDSDITQFKGRIELLEKIVDSQHDIIVQLNAKLVTSQNTIKSQEQTIQHLQNEAVLTKAQLTLLMNPLLTEDAQAMREIQNQVKLLSTRSLKRDSIDSDSDSIGGSPLTPVNTAVHPPHTPAHTPHHTPNPSPRKAHPKNTEVVTIDEFALSEEGPRSPAPSRTNTPRMKNPTATLDKSNSTEEEDFEKSYLELEEELKAFDS